MEFGKKVRYGEYTVVYYYFLLLSYLFYFLQMEKYSYFQLFQSNFGKESNSEIVDINWLEGKSSLLERK